MMMLRTELTALTSVLSMMRSTCQGESTDDETDFRVQRFPSPGRLALAPQPEQEREHHGHRQRQPHEHPGIASLSCLAL